MGYSLIVSDIDFTLLNSKKELSKKNIEFINKARDNGIIFGLATGRIYNSALEQAKKIGENIPILAVNGAMTVVDSQIKREHQIDYNSLIKARELAKEVGLNPYFYTSDTIYELNFNGDRYWTNSENLPFKIEKLDVHEFEKLEDKHIYKVFLYSENMDRLNEFRENVSDSKITLTSSFYNNLELTNKYANKGNALRELAEDLNIDISKTIAIGDNLNDLSMIKAAGLGVAVENGDESLKESADIITVSCDESAVAHIIKEYMLND